jgi:group I intron endonuclease
MYTYRATNTVNGKFYIGSAIDFKRRKRSHLRSKTNYPFHRALRKNPNAFEWEFWSDDCDEPVLEQALLDMWFGKEMCYNLNPNADRPPLSTGLKRSEETKQKMRKAKSGENNPCFGRTGAKNPMSERTGDKNHMFGKTHSEESNQKNREKHLGRKQWVNETGKRKFQQECPGPEWQNGTKWKPI